MLKMGFNDKWISLVLNLNVEATIIVVVNDNKGINTNLYKLI